jgi:hypothetical protein
LYFKFILIKPHTIINAKEQKAITMANVTLMRWCLLPLWLLLLTQNLPPVIWEQVRKKQMFFPQFLINACFDTDIDLAIRKKGNLHLY